MVDAGHHDGGTEEVEGVPPQVNATPGMPERKAVARRQARVREIMHTLPSAAQEAILEDLDRSNQPHDNSPDDEATARHRVSLDDSPTQVITTSARGSDEQHVPL